MAFNVFISYSTKDLERVHQLQESLVGKPIDVFIAHESIVASQDLSQAIHQAIERCDLFVVLWSSNAKASDWVLQEVGRASAYNKLILPLILDEGLCLPGFIQNLKHLSVNRDVGAFDKVRDFIVDACEKKAKKVAAAAAQSEKEKVTTVVGLGLIAWLLSKW